MSAIQAVLFDKKLFSQISSKRALSNMNLKQIKPVHLTRKYYRYRIREPNEFAKLITKQTQKGITLIIGFYN